jgi:hypothetical protein
MEGADCVVDIGESWAYRARSIDQPVEVRVLRIGTGKPTSVQVRFVAAEFEGREEWVPPARLKVPWSAVDEFTARERRWDAVIEVSWIRDTAEHFAASAVFHALIDESLATIGFNNRAGVATIHDLDGLARFLEVDPGQLRADSRSFIEDDALVVPWSITQLIVQRAAQRNPDRILRRRERRSRARAAQSPRSNLCNLAHEAGLAHRREYFVESEDEPDNRPCWDLLRQWCGVEAATRRDELHELRKEVARLGSLMQQAIACLRAAKQIHDADRLERAFGVPVEDLRA